MCGEGGSSRKRDQLGKGKSLDRKMQAPSVRRDVYEFCGKVVAKGGDDSTPDQNGEN